MADDRIAGLVELLDGVDHAVNEVYEEWRRVMAVRSEAGERDSNPGYTIAKTGEFVENEDFPVLLDEQKSLVEKYALVRDLVTSAQAAVENVQSHYKLDEAFDAFDCYTGFRAALSDVEKQLKRVKGDAETAVDQLTERVVHGPQGSYDGVAEGATALETLRKKLEQDELLEIGSAERDVIDERSAAAVKELGEGESVAFWLDGDRGTPLLFVGSGFPELYTGSLQRGVLTMEGKGGIGSRGSVSVSNASSHDAFEEAYGRFSKKEVVFR